MPILPTSSFLPGTLAGWRGSCAVAAADAAPAPRDAPHGGGPALPRHSGEDHAAEGGHQGGHGAGRRRCGPHDPRRQLQRAERGVYPVQVAAAISREEAVGDSDLIDSQPGVALQATLLRLST